MILVRSMLVEIEHVRDRIFQFECSTVDTLKKNLCACPARAGADVFSSILSVASSFCPPPPQTEEGLHRPAGKKAISYRYFYIW